MYHLVFMFLFPQLKQCKLAGTQKCISVWSCGRLTKTAHTCYQPFNDSTPFGAPNRGRRERIVPLLNPDGRGQWYCHPFRGCRGHVAHPLARFKGAVGKGRPRAAVAGAVTDVHPSAKANTRRWVGVRVGPSKGWSGYWEISLPCPCPLLAREGERTQGHILLHHAFLSA